ncbi:MAG: hypothetical protein CFH14_00287 [Alphaproteobacteria bacterium MarineAlpha5_Bin4]|nr:MAG: hypothetical protein CFH14_00287 [Alphaproteobacteria bacterium MarineAlpha5_Bin4]|tara:strand:- start:161 stop:1009 length:849 start_codon:yes stop_codon:yes gene_type:complete
MMKKLILNIYNFIFLFFEKYFKIHITRAHFYSPIPDLYEIQNKDYEKVFKTDGVNLNIKYQIANINILCKNFSHEFIPYKNDGLSLVDSFMLYAFIRQKKPKKIVEIGSGDTTKIILKALNENKKKGFEGNLFSINPYNKIFKSKISDNFEIINKKIQDMPLDFFKDLDFLFIDSSHISKFESDVNFEILEVIPIIKNKGAIIHWHDIHFPKNYSKDVIENKKRNSFWNESYMVHSFLLYNNRYKIIYAGKYLQLYYFDILKNNFPYLNQSHLLTSMYIQMN